MLVLIHKSQGEVFNCNMSVRYRQMAGELMPVVHPLVGDFFVKPGDLALCDPQISQRFLQPSWAFTQVARRLCFRE